MLSAAPARPTLIVSTSENPFALNLMFEGLGLQTQLPAEVLVADDGSDDQTTRVLEYWTQTLPFPIRRFWQPHEEARKAALLNRTVRASTGDYLIFLAGDCLPHRRFVADHVRQARRGTFVQGRRARIRARYVRRISPSEFHPLLLLLRGRLHGWRRGLRRTWPIRRLNDGSPIDGSNFGVWREDFFRVNGYDENFVGWGHKDAELAERLFNAGVSCKTVVGQLIVYHLDHSRVARYWTGVNERILERTRREKRTRCDRGVLQSTSELKTA